MIPNRPTPTSATTTHEVVKAVIRKNPSGIIGSAWRLSQIRKATINAAPTRMNESV